MEYKFTITELTAEQAKIDAERSAQGLGNGVIAWQMERAVLSYIQSICGTFRK